MSTLFVTLLVAHVLLGFLAVLASFRVTLLLIKKTSSLSALVKTAWVAVAGYVLAWLFGGWYYWKYYGANVKPVIVGGDYKWAHLVFMEAKEHVFLFLPFAALCIALVLWANGNELATNDAFRKKVAFLSLMTTILAVIVTLSGILITGGAR